MILTTALMCVALNVYHEARGEPLAGQIAVAYVTHKRAGGKSSQYCREVYRKAQFSWTASKPPVDKKSPQWKTAVAVAKTFLLFPDMSLGATHYHAKSVAPQWSKSFKVVSRIGDHIFYRVA